MSKGVQPKGESLRNFLIQSIIEKQPDIVNRTIAKYKITRQGVNQHIKRLQRQGSIEIGGSRRKPRYTLVPIVSKAEMFSLKENEEHEVWESFVLPLISALPSNVMKIWNHAFTEMFNNAIDHSECTHALVSVERSALSTEILISDTGVGIFKKIHRVFELEDERQAIFELAKGKLTTDPKNHSGEGIFFTSRMLDLFTIRSGELFFSHNNKHMNDWLLDDIPSREGTTVTMAINNHSSRTTKKIFDQY